MLFTIPIKYRKGIPFFYPKSESEFRADKYEYSESVQRQLMLHFGDEWHGNYPFQPVLDVVLEKTERKTPANILEIGCSVGRMIGDLAEKFPETNCWGIDYSYQLLKRANNFYLDAKKLELDGRDKGFGQLNIKGKRLSNLHFALAKAEHLPFEKESMDLVFSSFTLDRFDQPITALQEVFRVLKKEGKCVFISPLNFQKKEHWVKFYPIQKLEKQMELLGFSFDCLPSKIEVKEPLDARGNHLVWDCVTFCLRK